MRSATQRIDDSIFLVAGFLFLLLFTSRAAYSWGEASRLATVEALVERGTPSLDGGSLPGHGDKLVSSRGMVSHKPPGMQLLMAPFYWLLTGLGFNLADRPGVVYTVLTLLFCGGSWLFCGYALHRRQRQQGMDRWISVLLTGSLLFASLMLPYALALNAHLPAGAFILVGLLLLAGQPERYDLAIAGLLFGVAFSFDHAAMFFIAPALGFRLLHTRSGFLPILAGLAPGVVVSMWWYYSLGGTPFPLVFQQERFNYEYSPWLLMSLTGDKLAGSPLRSLFDLTFGESGLFSNHPILILPLAGLVHQWRRRGEWIAGAAFTGAVLTILWYAWKSRNQGGDCFGVRWFAILVPSLGIGLPSVAEWIESKRMAVAFGLLLVPSLAFAVVGADQPWMKLHLSQVDVLQPRTGFAEHLGAELRRRDKPPPDFTVREFRRFYRDNLQRLLRVTRKQAEAGRGVMAFEAALPKTEAMLEKTRRDPILWEVHAELLEGAGRYVDAAEARKEAEALRSPR